MTLPYQVATLLYCFNERDEVLLLERTREPNRGLWSPCGGKLQKETGESPYACACREAREELGLLLRHHELHLTGIVSEHGYEGRAHWLMFLFEVKRRLKKLPPQHPEGLFKFPKRIWSRFGHCSGGTVGASSPPIAIAKRMVEMCGASRRVSLPQLAGGARDWGAAPASGLECERAK